jgi:hypothetical protein
MPMAKCRLSTPDDPMYAEGPQTYNPHWSRSLPKSKPAPSSPDTVSGPEKPEQASHGKPEDR